MITKNIDVIKQFEGCRLTSYQDSGGVWTIGYGHTPSYKGQKITQSEADKLLRYDIQTAEMKVNKMIQKGYDLTQSQFDSLVSFCFNVGNIIQLTNNYTRSLNEIANKMLLYNKVNGKVVQGLTNRRKAERELFLGGNLESGVKLVDKLQTIKNGSKGNQVKLLQIILTIKGYNLTIDGTFGTDTVNKVKRFQSDNGLVVDGVVGKNTWSKVLY